MHNRCAEKVSLFFSVGNKIDFCRYIFENNQISVFVKIGPVGSKLSLADGQTDGRSGRQANIMYKLIIAFHSFAKKPQVRGVHTIVNAIPYAYKQEV